MNDFASTPELDPAARRRRRRRQGRPPDPGRGGHRDELRRPVDAALDFARQGAEWIHLVDLDAAFGRGSNAGVLRKVIKQVRGVQVELSGGIRDDRTLEAALESGAARINLGTAALENPEWAADVIGRYGDVIAVGPRRARHDARRARLDAGGRRPVDRARPARSGRLQPLRRHRRHEGRHPAGPEPRSAARDHRRARPSRSSRRAACRASTTSPRCATSCRSASRARSSARRSTPARSRSPRRWMSPDTDAAPRSRRGDSAGVPWEGRSFEPNRARRRRRLRRSRAARRADGVPRGRGRRRSRSSTPTGRRGC